MTARERRGKPLRRAIVRGLATPLLDLLMATLRFDVLRDPEYEALRRRSRPVVFVLWHGRLLPLSYLHRGEGVMALISRSRDGDDVTALMRHWGFVAARGSSSHGGSEALRDVVRAARSGHSLAITPDGPRGPRERMKLGALTAAQLSGLPVVPVAAGARRAWWIEGWDRFLVPRPFARVRVAYGAPRMISAEADRPSLSRIAAQLEADLATLMQVVDGDDGAGR